MADRFTEVARRALDQAKSAAQELGAGVVGTEHILLGLLRVGEGLAYEVLTESNVHDKDITELIRKYLQANYSVIEFPGYEYTPMSNRVLNSAVDKAKLYHSSLVGTEHILLGILSYPNCSACRILTALGLSLERLHLDIVSMLQQNGADGQEANQARPARTQSRTPMLDQYSRDLSKMAEEGSLDPVIGREQEISRVIQILSRRTKNNPCLIGEPGVGKTAVVEGLALRIQEGSVPDIMRGKRIVSLDLSGMVAGSKYRGEFEERIKTVDGAFGSDGG